MQYCKDRVYAGLCAQALDAISNGILGMNLLTEHKSVEASRLALITVLQGQSDIELVGMQVGCKEGHAACWLSLMTLQTLVCRDTCKAHTIAPTA